MPTAIVRFSHCIQDSQDYGSDDEHMVSQVFFAIEADGETFEKLVVDVKQSVGEAFDTAVLEVSLPRGYGGSLNYAPFREAVESYYRSCVGSAGRGIRIEGGTNIRMRNNVIRMPGEASVEYTENSPAW